MRIAVRGLEFDVDVAGPEGAPAVVLLHGFPQNATMWHDLASRLNAAGLRTVAPNQRGYSPGARPSDVDAYHIGEPAADVLSIMDSLGIDAAHVVGHDWGAAVAWQLGSRHPARVRTLTAISVPHPRAVAVTVLTDRDQRKRLAYIRLFRAAGKAEAVLLADGGARLRGMAASAGLDEAGIDRYVTPMLEPGALTGALNWYRAIRLTDSIRTGKVRVPTTFVWSDRDVAVGRPAAERCGRQVSGDYRFVALAGVGHWIPDEAPDALAEAVLARIGMSAAAE